MKPRLLLVDDDDEIRTQMRWALATDYDLATAGSRAEAIELSRSAHPPVVLLDLGLPPTPATPAEGLLALSELLALDHLTKVVIVSGQGEHATALNAIGAGAYDFLAKPVDLDELKLLLKRCFHVAELERQYHEMQQRLQGDSFEGLLGTGVRMQAVFDSIRKIATSEVPVLILGESGTGKEVTARAIHHRSSRKGGPFVAINCSAIPETLIESELFGHEKGAFTGAHLQRKGRIEHAEGGTLFLDEIGEIPLAIQVKLLRFLQEQYIERVGGRQEIIVDTRVVAATSADLKKAMSEGKFREDLFYRLAVIQIVLPPLRERDDDAVLMARAFLHRFAAEAGRTGLSFSPDAIRAIRQHSWPGNVRELQNRVKRAVVMGDGRRLVAADLELADAGVSIQGGTLREARENLEREMINQALHRSGGKISAAAAELGISRPTLYELMDKLGLRKFESAHSPESAT